MEIFWKRLCFNLKNLHSYSERNIYVDTFSNGQWPSKIECYRYSNKQVNRILLLLRSLFSERYLLSNPI